MVNTSKEKLKLKIKKLDREIQKTPIKKTFSTPFLKKVSKYNLLLRKLKGGKK